MTGDSPADTVNRRHEVKCVNAGCGYSELFQRKNTAELAAFVHDHPCTVEVTALVP